MVHYNFIIKGKVQGVNYRLSAKNKAQELKLKGYVKNLLNGEVYMEVEGDETKVLQLADWCHIGPTKAIVTSVEIESGQFRGYENFQVRQ